MIFEGIPLVGEKVSHPSGLIIEVLDADNRKVKRLKVFKD
jgi:CBS domain containing-hemolysin-like protein